MKFHIFFRHMTVEAESLQDVEEMVQSGEIFTVSPEVGLIVEEEA